MSDDRKILIEKEGRKKKTYVCPNKDCGGNILANSVYVGTNSYGGSWRHTCPDCGCVWLED